MSRAASDEKVSAVDPDIAEHCFEGEHEDEVLFEPLKAASTVMFRIQGQSNNHCYDLWNWGQVIKVEAEKQACIWIPERREGGDYAYIWPAANRRAWLPVLKLPRAFIYVQTTPQLLSRFTTFLIFKTGKASYSTPFGMSALHAVNEDIYTIVPINRSSLLKKNFVVEPQLPGYTFQPNLEDVRNGELEPDTVVMVQANGSFTEINKVTGELYGFYDWNTEFPNEPGPPKDEEKEREEKALVSNLFDILPNLPAVIPAPSVLQENDETLSPRSRRTALFNRVWREAHPEDDEKVPESHENAEPEASEEIDDENYSQRRLLLRLNRLMDAAARIAGERSTQWSSTWETLIECAEEWAKGKVLIYPPERSAVRVNQINDVFIGEGNSVLSNDPNDIMRDTQSNQIVIEMNLVFWPRDLAIPSQKIRFASANVTGHAKVKKESNSIMLTITRNDVDD